MKLREFNFNEITSQHIAIGNKHKWYEEITIGETLGALPEDYADREIVDTRMFFGTFVIEVEERQTDTQIPDIQSEEENDITPDEIAGFLGQLMDEVDLPPDLLAQAQELYDKAAKQL